MDSADYQISFETVQSIADAIRVNIAKVFVGKPALIDQILVALFSDGHILIEDFPGMGKTILARTLASSIDAPFHRVQGTPDLLPSDVTGVNYFDMKKNEFVFRPGPIFTSILLFDEINRATPRTQSALLEAMAERQVTIERETMPLPPLFLVLATQNPIEMAGTFPLPEAQIDRFLIRVRFGQLTEDEELQMMHRFKENDPLATLTAVATTNQIRAIQRLIRTVRWQPDVEHYLLNIMHATRNNAAIQLGASPRATLALYRASEALAAIHGRAYVEPDDVKQMAIAVLAHRIILNSRSRQGNMGNDRIMAEILAAVATPVEAVGR